MMSIRDIVATYGVNNVRIFMEMQASQSLHNFGLPLAMKSSSSPFSMVECRIEESRYKVAEGYKVTFAPVAEVTDGRMLYVPESLYQADFNSMRRQTPDKFQIFILVDEDGKYERLREDMRQAA